MVGQKFFCAERQTQRKKNRAPLRPMIEKAQPDWLVDMRAA